jgi:AraC-like DNA-binding protein
MWPGSSLFLGRLDDASPHAHHALQVAVSISSTFVLETPDKTFESRSVVIAPDQIHRFRGADDHAILLLDTESTIARQIQAAMCKESEVTEFDFSLLRPSIEQIGASIEKPLDCDRMKALCQQMLSRLAGQSSQSFPLDARIEKALDFAKVQPELKAPVEAIAQAVGLSEGRLVHLFKEQVGIPIRRYLLWLRLVHASGNLFENVSLTTAAHNAGFADSAHFTRTFRKMFGVTPSELFKNSRFVQVIPCPE